MKSNMAKIVVYIGKDRNKALASINGGHTIEVECTNYSPQENLQDLCNQIEQSIHMLGYVEIVIPNIEVIVPHTAAEWLFKSLKENYTIENYPEITFHISSCLPWYCWGANELKYVGGLPYDDVQLDRIKYGNILDAFGTNLLEF